MPLHPPELAVEDAMAEAREFVFTMGGFAVQIAGASLVTHERVPLPQFNYVDVRAVARERSSAFFERALDHYFQRALRPEFHVPTPVASHLEDHLRRLGFRRRRQSHTLLLAPAPQSAGPDRGKDGAVTAASDLETLIGMWAERSDRDELRRSVEVAWHSPHPGETLTPLVGRQGSAVVAGALRHTFRGVAGLHLIATKPAARGQGAATALVADGMSVRDLPDVRWVSVHADDPRLVGRLAPLGFRPEKEWVVFEFPPEAELSIPDPGPPSPPRWRPPRRPRAA